MTISSTTTVTRTNTNGSTHTFNFAHPFGDPDDLLVYLVTTADWSIAAQTKDTHYTVSNNGDEDENGGSITFINGLQVPTAPATGKVCVILRKPDLVQDFNPNGSYPSAQGEAALDRLYQVAQYLKYRSDRSIRLNDAYADATLELPDVTTRASKALVFDSDGNLTVGDTSATNLAAMTALEAAAAASASAAAASASTASTQATNATASASAADVSATLAEAWASKVNGIVASTDYSSRAYAIGGTGVTGAIGAAKEWAINPEDSSVDGVGGYSAFHWAQKAAQSAASVSTEAFQDIVGAMTSGNTESGISVSYQDADGTIDFEVTGVLEDLNTLGPPANDGEFLVATGAGALAWESGATARTSLGLGTGDSPQFTAINIGHASNNTLSSPGAGRIAIEGDELAQLPDLASTSNGLGASLIGVEDAGGYFTQTTVESVLAFIGARVVALDAAVINQGAWDASAGTFPGGGAAQNGWTYIVTVAGTVDGVAFAQNDRILAIADNASTSTYAANWLKLDYTDQVLSVAGKTGAVTIDLADITDMSAAARTFAAQTTQALMRTAGLGFSANGSSLVAAADYAAMRALLDLEAGTDFLSPAAIAAAYQPLDELLTEIAALSTAPGADRGLFYDHSSTAMDYWSPTAPLSFSGTALVVAAASDSAAGVSELATAAETTTGTDAARAVTPDGLAGSDFGKTVVSILVRDDSQDVNTGDGAGDVFWRVPAVLNGFNLVAVAAQVQTAGTTGTTDIQIHNVTQAADMLSTKITIDSGETDSSTAATPAVIDTGNDDVATGDRIRIDVDATSTTKAKGLLVELTFQLP